ncbi:GmrSD restriction endonuclease domain-containing protein [Nonomuraea antri]|uniref:GmrSD restriction endonuclease domain-containing protein n=1 Tax=Nonomuraea antri TaxID=2730852 RepID=UPI001C2C54C8|nr:DUF1524 domain-containing protein [Nonomuraea antri]
MARRAQRAWPGRGRPGWGERHPLLRRRRGERLDVDHLVPLAEAWDSGASAWDAARRERYANHLQHPEHLVAVTARSNRQKADKDPASWLPIKAVRCRYVVM